MSVRPSEQHLLLSFSLGPRSVMRALCLLLSDSIQYAYMHVHATSTEPRVSVWVQEAGRRFIISSHCDLISQQRLMPRLVGGDNNPSTVKDQRCLCFGRAYARRVCCGCKCGWGFAAHPRTDWKAEKGCRESNPGVRHRASLEGFSVERHKCPTRVGLCLREPASSACVLSRRSRRGCGPGA
jgi:hypothetical protein